MKLGWIVVQGPEEQRREARARLEVIADSFLSVNTPAQNAAADWLRFRHTIQAQVNARIQTNYSYAQARTKNSACQVLDTAGGWYTVLQIPNILTEEEWALLLLGDDCVLVHPGYFFDFEREAFLVVSLLPECPIFAAGLDRLVSRVIKEGGGK